MLMQPIEETDSPDEWTRRCTCDINISSCLPELMSQYCKRDRVTKADIVSVFFYLSWVAHSEIDSVLNPSQICFHCAMIVCFFLFFSFTNMQICIRKPGYKRKSLVEKRWEMCNGQFGWFLFEWIPLTADCKMLKFKMIQRR